ncbi:MAG: ABC transporter ATP-binding protein [Cyclobacteriaceae bacterium]
MIIFKDIVKSFSGVEILKGISGEFHPGQTNLIIGSSGTGKSVLLKSLVGLLDPDSGNITYDGRDFTSKEKNNKRLIRREIGMLFQGSALFDSMTVEENIMFPLNTFTKQSKEEKLERVNFCLERVGLENINHLTPSEISGGMKKRVGIARAIVMNPKYLFCDEPNSGLDPQTANVIDNLIQEITKEYNITTVVVTHDMNSVIEIGEHIIYMLKGEKLWEGNKDSVFESGNKQLNDFVFSNALLNAIKK